MKPLHFPFIKLTVCFVAGIWYGFYHAANWLVLLIALCSCLVVLYALYRKNTYPTVFGSSVFITAFLAGWFNTVSQKPTNRAMHYTHHIQAPEVEYLLQFKVRQTLKPTSLYHRYRVVLLTLNGATVSGNLLVNVEKAGAYSPLQIDGIYTTKTQLAAVSAPPNPHQFNYKKYLERQGIYRQVFLSPSGYYILTEKVSSLYGYAAHWRAKINNALQRNGFAGDELAVVNALLLGQQQDISEEVYQNYSKAGAIHILAVSGLHVSIFVVILNVLLAPLERLKKGRLVKLIIMVALLWLFALIAGLSASVVRSVAMFSFIAWAMHLRRVTHIYNILAISMFFLLLSKPSFLLDVGFQLSYAAVFSIVWLQPMLYRWWLPRFKAADFFWKILTVTLAAQVGVAPITLYYFHQFPGLFFVSNLIIIPFVGIILGAGLLLVVLALIDWLPAFLAEGYRFLIYWMNGFVDWVADRESFLFDDIPFDEKWLLALYVLLVLGVMVGRKPVFSRIACFLIAILLLQGILISDRYNTAKTYRLIVFHKNRQTLIGEQKGAQFTVYAAEKSVSGDRMVRGYITAERIGTVAEKPLQNLYCTPNGKLLLHIDSLGIYNIPRLRADYVLLSHAPKINLERVLAFLKPTLVIADGSNYKSDIARWKKSCEKQRIPFYATGEKGAYILNASSRQ